MNKTFPGGVAMPEKKKDVISFHNTPSFYLEYTKNWLAQKRKEKAREAELAIVEDIYKLVKIAVGVLAPVPTESGTDKK